MNGRSMHEDDPLDDFTTREITLDGVAKRVYVAGTGPAVIVMAEMPGILSPGGIAQPTDGALDPSRVRTDFVLFKVAGDRWLALVYLDRVEGSWHLERLYD